MLGVEVRFLTGRYTATQYNDRSRAEWPPHPARLFSALVARWADEVPPDPAERAVLEWLERLGAPQLAVGDADTRAVVTHFVPVNDTTVLASQDRLYAALIEAEEALRRAEVAADRTSAAQVAALERQLKRLTTRVAEKSRQASGRAADSASARAAARQLLPDQRGRQGRTYPTSIPVDDAMRFIWPDADVPQSHAHALDRLLARVARLGHSSSMVACRLSQDAGGVTWTPDGGGQDSFRVMAPGLLARLELEFLRHGGSEPRTMPTAMAAYRRVDPRTRRTAAPVPLLGGEWLILGRSRGTTPPVTSGLRVAEAVRGALLAHAAQPSLQFISGHRPGAPGERTEATDQPHLAVVPLPYAGSRFADGSLLGVALVLPTDTTAADRDALLRTLGRWRSEDKTYRLELGGAGALDLELVDELDTRATLQRRTWCRPATRWVSVTPVALDRFPGDLRDRNSSRRVRAEEKASDVIAQACGYAGLPRPWDVQVELDTPMRGVPPLRAFPRFRRGNGSLTRACVHVRLTFSQPVVGPVLLGAGRYLGYGLCRPVVERGNEGV